jgi:hypothetical protein
VDHGIYLDPYTFLFIFAIEAYPSPALRLVSGSQLELPLMIVPSAEGAVSRHCLYRFAVAHVGVGAVDSVIGAGVGVCSWRRGAELYKDRHSVLDFLPVPRGPRVPRCMLRPELAKCSTHPGPSFSKSSRLQ